MRKPATLRAEAQFAAAQKKTKEAVKENERARQKRTEHVASLRALRLAKEVTGKEAAEAVAAKKGTAKNKKPSRLPKGHRRKS